MIARFFNKTHSINFLIVCLLSIGVSLSAQFVLFHEKVNIIFVLQLVAKLVLAICNVLLFQFIVKKNSLVLKHDGYLLLFGLLFLALPQTVFKVNILFANLGVLLALRRLLSLHSGKNSKKKILDASLLITISAMFYPMVIVFFSLIFLAVFYFKLHTLKTVLIPFLGFFSWFCSAKMFTLIAGNTFQTSFFPDTVNFNYTAYNSVQFIMLLTTIFSLGIWTAFNYFKVLNKKKRILRPVFILVFYWFLIALFIIVIAFEKTGAEIIFCLAPFSLITANYIENIKEFWFKNIFVLAFIAVTIFGFFQTLLHF